MQLTTVIEREGDGYVALCPQLDIASQGDTVALARENLKEALELFSRQRMARKSYGDSTERWLLTRPLTVGGSFP